MLRQRTLIWLTLALLVVFAAASVSAQEKTVVSIAFWGGIDDLEVNQALKEAFEAENPDIEVELLHLPDEYGDKINTMIASGTAPDVIMQAEGFSSYAAAGTILPLDSFIASDPDFPVSDYFPLVVDAYRFDGNLYVLPSRWSPLILYYNPYLFDLAGVAPPNEDWDWDEFTRAASTLTRGEGAAKTWGIGSIGDWWPWWMTPIHQNGGRILDEERRVVMMDQPEAIEALEWYWSLLHEHEVNPVGDDWLAYDGLGPDQLFEQGITAMNQTGFWAVYWLRYHDSDFDVALLPKQKQRATTLFSNGWAITSQSQNPDAAWRLIRFMTDTESQVQIAQSGKDVPVRLSVATSSFFLDPELPPAHAQLILEAASHIVPPPVTPAWDEMLGLMGAEIVKVINNELTPTQAVSSFKAAVDALLQSY